MTEWRYRHYLEALGGVTAIQQRRVPPFTMMMLASLGFHIVFLFAWGFFAQKDATFHRPTTVALRFSSPSALKASRYGNAGSDAAQRSASRTATARMSYSQLFGGMIAQTAPSKNAPTVRGRRNESSQSQESTGQSYGTGEEVRRYEQALSLAIAQQRVYPQIAFNQRLQGTTILTITIDRQGRLLNMLIYKSSSHAILDQAAAAAVRLAAIPVPPEYYPGGKELVFRVPVIFELRE